MKLKSLLIPLSILCILFNANAQETATDNDEESSPKVVLDTSMGSIVIELYPKRAPLNVAHFLKQVDADRYDGIVFHRVMADFVIQAGSWDEDYKKQNIDETVKNEARRGLSNKTGTVAMAQKPGNPDSGSLDFFINLKNNDHLDYTPPGSMQRRSDGYTVFGKVVEGMDVVEKIAAVSTETKELEGVSYPLEDAPIENVVIKETRRQDDEDATP